MTSALVSSWVFLMNPAPHAFLFYC
jgi:hypothetical protein